MGFASISIDMDTIDCYHAIHGLPVYGAKDPAYALGLTRFLELMADLNLPATLFAVGQDAQMPERGQLLQQASKARHEIANHTFSHNYRIVQFSPEEMKQEVERGAAAIDQATGVWPTGFRAPGYNVSDDLFEVLEQQGYLYDSSIFPSPVYFGARAFAIAQYWLRRQPSRSLSGDPRQFMGPRHPYRPRPGAPHSGGSGATGRALIELPVAVVPHLRLPFIGTSLAMVPASFGRALTAAVLSTRSPVNFELHPIDFLDGSDPGINPALTARQPDLKVPASKKIGRLRQTIQMLAKRRTVTTMAQLARHFDRLV